jgi:hypothetical protein
MVSPWIYKKWHQLVSHPSLKSGAHGYHFLLKILVQIVPEILVTNGNQNCDFLLACGRNLRPLFRDGCRAQGSYFLPAL